MNRRLYSATANISTLLLGALANGICIADQLAEQLAEQPWHYTLTEEVRGQQANFCLTETATQNIAQIFATAGPRPGYAALSRSDNCFIRVQSFTPLEIITQITIAGDKPNEYQVTFVKIETKEGDTQYLVTTRRVKEPKQKRR